MKKYFIFATALAALASCSSDDFVGESPNGVNSQESGAITFTSSSKAVTRAETGKAAADLLNNNFVVEGIKTVSSGKVEVFDNYNVNWAENTADKTASNTANWEYVGETIIDNDKEASQRRTSISEQTIKYWDYAASQYDFWAYSLGGGNATVSTLAHDATLGTSAYTIEGDLTNLAKVYISDLTTAYDPKVTDQPEFGKEVSLTFRSLVCKVRIGLYETVPGYSIKNVQFYPSSSGTATGTAALYAASEALPSVPTSGTSTYTVTFPTTGSSNVSDPDYNKAHVTFPTTGTKASKQEFGSLNYNKAVEKYEKTGGTSWLGRTSAEPTWSGLVANNYYTTVLPNEDGTVLTLKVDYTLESTDGSGETITVHGATALIPSQYTKWKPNYAYTYLFKISDNTNGKTDATKTPEGLRPITLNAVVVNSEDGTQETITTVATPSITTYSLNSNVTTNNEYTTSDDIYVIASTDGTLQNLNNYGATLYTVSKTTATEAEVLAALTTYTSLTDGTYVGRNSITLAPVADGLDLTKTEIPLIDGNKITGLTAGQVALIDKSKLTAGTYAFVYKTTEEAAVSTKKYEAVTVAANGAVDGLFTKNDGSDTAATINATAEQTLYARYYTVNNVTYAIKVIKIKS